MIDIRDLQLVTETSEIVALSKENHNYKLQNTLLLLFGGATIIILSWAYYNSIQEDIK